MADPIIFWQGSWPRGPGLSYAYGRVVVIDHRVFVEKEVRDSLGVSAWVEMTVVQERDALLTVAVAHVANKIAPKTSWERLDEEPNAPSIAAAPVAAMAAPVAEVVAGVDDEFSSLLDF